MSTRALLVDGFDLSTLGLVVDNPAGWRDGFSVSWPSTAVPGRIGEIVTSTEGQVNGRTLRIDGAVLASTVSALLSQIDEIKYRLGSTEKTFVFSDDETREFYAYCSAITHQAIDPALIQRGISVRIGLEQTDPRRYGTSDTVVSGITTSPVDIPLGTAPVFPSITVTGASGFTLTYKDSSAVAVATIVIAGATSPVTLDCEAGTVVDGGGNAVAYLTSTSDFPFAFDPADGDYTTSDWPTLEVTAGTAVATYRKAYR